MLVERSQIKNNQGFKTAFIILWICATPILLPVGFAFLIVFGVFIIVYASLVFSFGVASFACFLGLIPLAIDMIKYGIGFPSFLFYLGIVIIAGGVMMLLAISVFYVGKKLLHYINKTFSLLIKKVVKGGKQQ